MPLNSRHFRTWRRSRVTWFSRRLWRRRLVFVVGALLVGLASVGFALAADEAHGVYQWITTQSPYLPLLVTPLGFGLLAWLTRRYFDGSQGSGIPQAIAARRLKDDGAILALLGWRVSAGKVILTLGGLAVGASIGREGPTVQLGASIMLMVALFSGMGRRPGLILAGSAAGIAGAFNTPLAGIVFAIEEMAKAYERRIGGLVAATVMLSGLVSLALLGNYLYFGQVELAFGARSDWLAVPLCGLVGGAAGGLFSRGVVAATLAREGWLGRLKSRPVLFAAGCGLIVALLALATDGFAAGAGYGPTRLALEEGLGFPWWYAPLKLIATLLSSVSGLPGGLFSPSLAVGAGLGAGLSELLAEPGLVTLMVLAMTGYFAGVVQAPLTAFVIIMEMTAGGGLVLPIMTTALIGAGTSRLIAPESLYHALSVSYLGPR